MCISTNLESYGRRFLIAEMLWGERESDSELNFEDDWMLIRRRRKGSFYVGSECEWQKYTKKYETKTINKMAKKKKKEKSMR